MEFRVDGKLIETPVSFGVDSLLGNEQKIKVLQCTDKDEVELGIEIPQSLKDTLA
jgi:hypothetical protein